MKGRYWLRRLCRGAITCGALYIYSCSGCCNSCTSAWQGQQMCVVLGCVVPWPSWQRNSAQSAACILHQPHRMAWLGVAFLLLVLQC